MVLDHLHLRVSDMEASKTFYSTVLESFGLRMTWEGDGAAEFGVLFLSDDGVPTRRAHFAFTAKNRKEVEAFHAAGLAAGYQSNGPPGERAEYHPGYYASYLLDPDGNNVEAVFHGDRVR